MTKNRIMLAIVSIFALAWIATWIFHGQGVVHNDAARNIYIPDELTMPLQVKVAYNEENIFFRYRWPAKQPHIYHDMLVYQSGKWVRHGGSQVGPQAEGIYEDRVTMLVDDGSVPEFAAYGGYLVIGDAMRFFTRQAGKKEVKEHPYLGKKKHKSDVRKYLPETRHEAGDWSSTVDEARLRDLREAGYFLDLWHWRAHRSNPAGKADDQFIADFRYGDKGQGVYFTNWDKANKRPRLMFDREKIGRNALKWDDLLQRKLGFDDVYSLQEKDAKPFDVDHAWQEGDAIPRRILRPGSGSHADISVAGDARWNDGFWDVALYRKLDTGNPLDDKAFRKGGRYSVAFAVHRNATGSRWHYVSLPFSLGLDRKAEIPAAYFSGQRPDWERQDWSAVQLFYPGQVNWPLLTGDKHAGAGAIARNIPVKARHSEKQLANYAVELEFDEEIRLQWLLTLLAGIILILSFGLAVYRFSAKGRN